MAKIVAGIIALIALLVGCSVPDNSELAGQSSCMNNGGARGKSGPKGLGGNAHWECGDGTVRWR